MLVLFGVAPVPAEAGKCPDPRTCDHYESAYPYRWARAPDGLYRIPYWINPAQPWVSETRAIGAIRAAFATWQRVLPTVRFDYKGTTTLPPVPLDGKNVVGWAQGIGLASTTLVWISHAEKRTVEADTYLGLLLYPYGVYPCKQMNGSCTDLSRDFFAEWDVTRNVYPFNNGARPYDIINIEDMVVHEVGHWIGLDDLYGEMESELTMYGIYSPRGRASPNEVNVERRMITLGLGDILGARKIYPCRCPLPTVYAP